MAGALGVWDLALQTLQALVTWLRPQGSSPGVDQKGGHPLYLQLRNWSIGSLFFKMGNRFIKH